MIGLCCTHRVTHGMVQSRYLCIPYIRLPNSIYLMQPLCRNPYRSFVFSASNLPWPMDAPIGRMDERRRTSAIITEYECASACGVAVDTLDPSSRSLVGFAVVMIFF